MHDPFILTLVTLFGLAIGSFLNVVIYRLPLGKSLIRPTSSCPQCGEPIKPYDNIPIISYIILKGRCRNCGERISPRYVLVESISGAAALLAILYFGLNVRGIETAILSFVFIAIFFIDLDHTIIPDLFTIPGIVIGLGVSFIPGAFVNWSQALLGALIGGGAFFLVGTVGRLVFRKEALGLGDVKFAAMLGAFIGWMNLLLVLVLASFFGSLVGIALIVLSKKGKRSYIPFGPFLVAGAWLTIYFGDQIIRAYLQFVGLAP